MLSALIFFFSPFFGAVRCKMFVDVISFVYCSNILKLHDKCAMSSLRCLLFFVFTLYWPSTFFLLQNLNSILMQKIDFKSTINYLFCKRALFLFAYNFVKKMFNPKLLNFRIKKMKRVVANHETEHVGRDKKREKTSKRPAVKISFLVEHNQHLKEMGKQREPTRTWMSFV